MERVLMIQLPQKEQVTKICAKLKIRVTDVPEENFIQTIGSLAGFQTSIAKAPVVDLPQEGILVFCELKEKNLDKFLELSRKAGLNIPYKAILTPTNMHWTVSELYKELKKEREAISAGSQADHSGSPE